MFRVLGPVQVLRGGKPVGVTGGTALSLLAALLVSPNQVVSAADLINLVWDGEGPAHPAAALQSAVFRLRRLLGEAVVETVGRGYRVCARSENLDLLEFRRLTAVAAAEGAQGADQAAVAFLDQALGLWRLPVLGNVNPGVLSRDVAPRLTDQYLDAHEMRAALCLRLGWHRRIADELAGLVNAFSFREQLAGCLMVALYRCGRQAEALAVYDKLRRSLAEELGVDPSAELQELHLHIVRADLAGPEEALVSSVGTVSDRSARAADPVAGIGHVPRQLPPDIADFIGREAELSLARDLLARADRDRPYGGLPICILTGPGGVGKSALAVHTAHQISAAYPDGQLYVDLQGAGDRHADPGEILSRFLRALGVAGQEVPAGQDERAALYRSLVADRRMLVLLDNAADEGQIRQLLPGGTGCAVIVTARSRITGLPGGQLIQLGMLDDGQATELLQRVAGASRISAEPAETRALVRLTGGLPLALRIVGARLAARPHWQISTMAGRLADGRRRLSELRHGDLDVRASLALSYQGLAPAARTLLRRIALLEAPDLPAWAGAALLDRDLAHTQDLFDRLLDAQLVQTAGHESGESARYRCHDLIHAYARELALTEDSAAVRKAALARTFGALLALSGRAHQQIYGGDYTILHGTAPRWLAADMDPAKIVGKEPLAWLEGERMLIVAAVRQGADLGLDEFCWDQAWIAVTLFQTRGYLDDWRMAQEQAIAAARQAGNLRGEAAMLTSLASRLIHQQDYDGARVLSKQGAQLFTKIGDRHGYALCQQWLAWCDKMSGRLDLALARYEGAREAVREAGDLFMEMSITREMARIHIDRGELAAASKYLDQTASISRDIGSAYAYSIALHMRGQLYLRQGRPLQAEHVFGQVLHLAQTNGDLIGQLHARLGLAEALLDQERTRTAESQLAEVLDSAPRLHQQFIHARALLVLGRVQADRKDYDEAAHSLRASIEIFRCCKNRVWEARALDALSVLHEVGEESGATGRAVWRAH